MPMISVIVPVYKVEKYIHRCVDSILGQIYTDFELILVDDGSPDSCGTICDEYASKDPRVVVIHQENGGISAARNAGIDWAYENSDSQWISFIDSDDWIHREYLQRLLDAAMEHNVSVSICSYVQTSGEEYEMTPKSPKSVLKDTENFYIEYNVNATIACGKLYRKECFSGIRYPVGKIFEDGFVTYKILFQNSVIAFLSDVPYYYSNPKGIMQSPFSLKKYDGIEAREERIAFFTQHGYSELAQREKCNLEYEIALFAIAARKTKIYKMVPSAYRRGWLNSMRIVRRYLTFEQFSWIMNPYHPYLVKMLEIMRRVKDGVCAKKVIT